MVASGAERRYLTIMMRWISWAVLLGGLLAHLSYGSSHLIQRKEIQWKSGRPTVHGVFGRFIVSTRAVPCVTARPQVGRTAFASPQATCCAPNHLHGQELSIRFHRAVWLPTVQAAASL